MSGADALSVSVLTHKDKKEVIGLGSSEKMTAFVEKTAANQDSMDSDKLCFSRLMTLFDPDSFVSLDKKVVSRPFSQVFERPPVEGDGVVTGYGTIGGRLVFAASQDPDVYGGSIGRAHAMKIVKVIEMAVSSGSPFIALYSSGGARVEEGVLALEGLGAILSALSDAKGQIPLLCAVLGHCPGGLALAAAKSDFMFLCEGVSGLYMNSPVITAALSGGKVNPSDIGTADIHRVKTGLASFVLSDEESCLLKIRELMEYIPVITGDTMAFSRDAFCADDPNRTSEKLNELASGSDNSGLPVREVFAEISDMQLFLEISEGYGTDMAVAFSKLDGITVGLIGNAAPRLTETGARKASKFIRFCTAFMIPLITFTDAEGFEIGAETEESGILEAAADLVSAFSESDVPRVGVLVGKAIGTAYLAMNSKMLGADMVFAWPTAQVAVMSADTAANILYREDIAGSEDPVAARIAKVEEYDKEISNPEVAAGYGQIDELILPSVTRPRIISALDILLCGYPLVEKE